MAYKDLPLFDQWKISFEITNELIEAYCRGWQTPWDTLPEAPPTSVRYVVRRPNKPMAASVYQTDENVGIGDMEE